MKRIPLLAIALATLAGFPLASDAGSDSFPRLVPALTGAPPEGFAIGRAHAAYNGGVDGSIYKMNLRTGEGEILVEGEPGFDIFTQCLQLGMRVDRRSNYLFTAGCLGGNATVFDADTGEELMQYQLAPEFSTVINDLTITREAVYFTDFAQPFLYRLPLSRNGRLPAGADAATALPLTGDMVSEDPSCCAGNGIVAAPDGKALIVGNSNNAQLYRVDPETGQTDNILVDPPLSGFIDGIVLRDNTLYVLTPALGPSVPEMIQVVALDEAWITGERVGFITSPSLDGVASGAIFGSSLYVNNARYSTFPQPDTEYWIAKLSIFDIQ